MFPSQQRRYTPPASALRNSTSSICIDLAALLEGDYDSAAMLNLRGNDTDADADADAKTGE